MIGPHVSIRSYSLGSVLYGICMVLLIWPVLIYVGIQKWRIKRGWLKPTPIDGGVVMLLSFVCMPCTIALYLCLIVWQVSK